MIALVVVIAILAMLLAPALLLAWVQARVIEARHQAWCDGFDEARRIDRRTERRWDGLETRERRPRGKGPREVFDLVNFS